jgi:hypothetical protein
VSRDWTQRRPGPGQPGPLTTHATPQQADGRPDQGPAVCQRYGHLAQGGSGLRGSIGQHHLLTLPPRKLGHLPAHLDPSLMLPSAGAGEGLRHPPLLRPLGQPDQTNGLRPPRTTQRLAGGGDPDRPCRVNRAEGDKACRTRPPTPSNACQHHRCDHDHPGRSRPGGPTPARTSPLTWPLPNHDGTPAPRRCWRGDDQGGRGGTRAGHISPLQVDPEPRGGPAGCLSS